MRKVSELWLSFLHLFFRKLFLFTPGENPTHFFAVFGDVANSKPEIFSVSAKNGQGKKGNFEENLKLLHYESDSNNFESPVLIL